MPRDGFVVDGKSAVRDFDTGRIGRGLADDEASAEDYSQRVNFVHSMHQCWRQSREKLLCRIRGKEFEHDETKVGSQNKLPETAIPEKIDQACIKHLHECHLPAVRRRRYIAHRMSKTSASTGQNLHRSMTALGLSMVSYCRPSWYMDGEVD